MSSRRLWFKAQKLQTIQTINCPIRFKREIKMAKKLLVTDDALIIREMIKDIAIEAGWEIAGEASNGLEAIERYRQLKPDVVTLDIVMPDYDGIYGLRGIMEEDPSAKVLMVSAVNQTSLLKQAIQIGATDFTCKPFDKKHLVESLNLLAPQEKVETAS